MKSGTSVINNIVLGLTTVLTTGGTTILTTSSPYQTCFSGTLPQTVRLPGLNTLVGQSFMIQNDTTIGSLGILTVQSADTSTVKTMLPGTGVLFTCNVASGLTASSWFYTINGQTQFSDSNFYIFDNTDTSKRIFMDAAGTTGTTTTIASSQTTNKILTLPDATDTLVARLTSDTLKNKTITDNTNNVIARGLWNGSGTGCVSTYAAAAPVTGQYLVATAPGTATWQTSPKTFVDTTFCVYDVTDNTKAIKLNASGTTGTTTTLLSSQTTNKVLTLPDATDTLVAKATTDILLNKTITDNTNNVIARGLWNGSGTGCVSTYAAAAPVTGQYLVATTSTAATWQTLLLSVLDNTATPKYPTAPQTEGIWYGNNAKANCLNADSVNLGNFATAGANLGVSIGGRSANVVSSNNLGVAIGFNTQATGGSSVAIGNGAFANTNLSVAIGPATTASQSECVAIGNGVTSGLYTVAIGRGLSATNASTVCIGNTNTAVAGVCIGLLCNSTGGGMQINIGEQNTCTTGNQGTTTIGYQCSAVGTNALCFGRGNICTGVNFYGICMGNNSISNGGTAIGATVNAGTGAIAIGGTVNSTGAFGGGAIATDSVAIGQSILSNGISSVLIGSGVSSTVANAVAIGTGSNSNSITGSIVLNASGSALSPISASNALALGVNSLSVAPARFGLTINSASYQLPLYTSLFNSTVSSVTPLTLSSTSSKDQYITGTVAQSVMLPRVNNPTLDNGFNMTISNKSSATATVYSAGPINGLTTAAYTFPLTTITVGTTVGTFPATGTFLILTTSGLQSIVYTSFSAGVFTFASAGAGTAAIGSVVSTVITSVLTLPTFTEYYLTCNDNTAGSTNGNVNGWYVSPLVSGLVMDNGATSIRYPTTPQTEGLWYGTNTKAFTATNSVNIGQNSKSQGSGSIAIGTNSTSSSTNSIAIGVSANPGTGSGPHIAIGNAATCTNGGGGEAAISIGNSASCTMNNTTGQAPIAIGRSAVCNFGDMAIGAGATASQGIAIGAGATSNSPSGQSTAIGTGAYAGDGFGGYFGATAIGYGAQARNQQQVAVGHNAIANGNWSGCTAVGASAAATGLGYNQTAIGASARSTTSDGGTAIGAAAFVNNAASAVAIGLSSTSSAAAAISIGPSASSSAASAIAIGNAAIANIANSIVLGQSSTVVGAAAAFGLSLNTASVAPGRFGLTVNSAAYQLPLYTSLYNTPVSSTTPLTLTSKSAHAQYITGTVAQNVMLPPVNNPTLDNGFNVTISNKSTATATVYSAGPINGLTTAAYTFPLTTITIGTIVGTFPAGGGTFLILTTTGLQSIVYTSYAAGVLTFASAGTGTAAIGSVVSTVISSVLTLGSFSEYYVTCNDNTAGNTNGNVNGWYVSPLVSGLIMDNLATSIKYPTAPQTEGVWYGAGTKANCTSTDVVIGNLAQAGIPGTSVAIGYNARALTAGGNCSIAVGRNCLAGYSDVVIGQDAQSAGNRNVSIGWNARANGQVGVSIGTDATTTGILGVSIGNQTNSYNYGIAIGNTTKANGESGVAVGFGCISSAGQSVSIGTGSTSSAASAISIGYSAIANIANSIVLGQSATVLGASSAFGLSLNAATISPGRFGLTINSAGYQLPLYTSLFNSTVSSVTPLTLSSTSSKDQYITGTVAQSVMLPPVNNPTLDNGFNVTISNKSTATATVYSAGPINGLTTAVYTFPLTTITIGTIVGTFPAGGGTFLILTTTGLQSIVYTSYVAGVLTFASAGTGTAAIGSVVSTVITSILTLPTFTEYYLSCNDNTAGSTNGNVNGWYVSPLVTPSTTDTFLNKTLTANSNNVIARALWVGSGTGSVSTYAAAAPVTGQILVATGSSTATWQTLSTMSPTTFVDTTFAVYDATDNTKSIKLDASGTTGTSTTLLSSQTTNKILTLPDTTDTLVAKATIDSLTNKTITDNTNNVISRQLWVGSGTGSVSTYTAAAPVTGQILVATAPNTATWQSLPGAYSVVLSKNTVQAYSGGSTIDWDVVVSDQQSMYNGGTGGSGGTAAVIAPSTGVYLMVVTFYSSAAPTVISIYVNNVQVAANQSVVTGIYYNVTAMYPCAAGSTIQVRTANSAATIANPVLYNFGVSKLN